MAAVTLTKKDAKFNDITVETLTSGSTDGVFYTLPNNDESTILVAYNSDGSNAYDLTVKAPAAGKGTYAPAIVDKVVEIGAGKVALVMLESAKYLDITTGKIELDVENAAIKLALFNVK